MAEDFGAELRSRLPSQNIELIATERAKHAEELAYEIAKRSTSPLIISSSGDGGYNEVINGALKAQFEGHTVTTGVLPAGNANDHHANLNNDDFIEQVASGQPKQIDAIKITSMAGGQPVSRYAHSYIGIGLTPKVGRELNRTKLNSLNEILIAARVLLFAKATKLKIDGQVRAYDSLIFSNIKKMSKYMTVASRPNISDGKFEMTIFRRRHKLRLLGLLAKATLVGLKEDAQLASFSFTTVHETLVQTDGEILRLDAGVDVNITAEQQLLRCVV